MNKFLWNDRLPTTTQKTSYREKNTAQAISSLTLDGWYLNPTTGYGNDVVERNNNWVNAQEGSFEFRLPKFFFKPKKQSITVMPLNGRKPVYPNKLAVYTYKPKKPIYYKVFMNIPEVEISNLPFNTQPTKF